MFMAFLCMTIVFLGTGFVFRAWDALRVWFFGHGVFLLDIGFS